DSVVSPAPQKLVAYGAFSEGNSVLLNLPVQWLRAASGYVGMANADGSQLTFSAVSSGTYTTAAWTVSCNNGEVPLPGPKAFAVK
ncbi:MAG: hypothetical protein ACRELE_12075, partial [Gemmatimonadales bacterium]